MTFPKSITLTGLPNDCGLVAAAAHLFLRRQGVKARILNIRYSKTSGHTIVLFNSGKSICSFDYNGSMVYHNASWKTSPLLLAKAYVKANNVHKRVVGAFWL